MMCELPSEGSSAERLYGRTPTVQAFIGVVGGCDSVIRALTMSVDLSTDIFQFGQLFWEVIEVLGGGDWWKEVVTEDRLSKLLPGFLPACSFLAFLLLPLPGFLPVVLFASWPP